MLLVSIPAWPAWYEARRKAATEQKVNLMLPHP
jgi:hypothetical protein